MRGGLTEAERGVLLSTMSTELAAMMLGRSEGWVCRQRSALVDLPGQRSVQARAAMAAKPWRPPEDPFAPPVAARREPEGRPQTWREAGEAAVRQAAPVPRPGPRPERGASHPPRRWNDLRRAETARAAERAAVITPGPALLAEKHHERMFVRGKRAAGVSWFNIANMMGKTVPYLKGLYGEAGQ